MFSQAFWFLTTSAVFVIGMDGDVREAANVAARIISSSLLFEANSVPSSWAIVLRKAVDSAARSTPARILFEFGPSTQHGKPRSFLLWTTQLPEASSLSIKDARIQCESYFDSRYNNSGSHCVLLVRPEDYGYDKDKSSLRSVLIVLSTVQDAVNNGASLSDEDVRDLESVSAIKNISFTSALGGSLARWAPWRVQWFRRHSYESIDSARTPVPESKSSRWTSRLVRYGSFSLIALAILAAALLVINSRKDSIYDRYDTTGSDGPRHQLRIYWQNASEWAAANPQDNGKWKFRIDDQAIIPAELYDDDEERYQQWYRTRYPEMQQVIDNRDYIKPSWMGSLKMKVPWDDQFHFAHCVLALRRYWKAKETGKHVCGRDIDYLHIDHCLGSLEQRVFIDGPRDVYDPPIYMYWQTKVCF